jgi:hypothetical protein
MIPVDLEVCGRGPGVIKSLVRDCEPGLPGYPQPQKKMANTLAAGPSVKSIGLAPTAQLVQFPSFPMECAAHRAKTPPGPRPRAKPATRRTRLASIAPAQRAARLGQTVRLRVVVIGGSARNGSRLGGLGQLRGGEGVWHGGCGGC